MPKHHFVPQFYLRRFCDPCVPVGYEPFLWVNNRTETGWKKKAPRNCGYEIGMYSVAAEDSELVEKFYSSLETMMAKVYKESLDSFDFPREKEREVISIFAGSCATRSPMMRWNHERMAKQVLEKSIKLVMRKPSFLDGMVKETGMDREEAERVHKLILENGGYKVSVKKEYLTATGINVLPVVTEIVSKMKWKLLIAPFNEYFVTTDSPACWEDPCLRHSVYGNSGLALKNVEFILPLSRKLCLLAGWNYMEGVFVAKAEQVRRIVNRCISWSSRQICSPRPFELVPQDKSKDGPIIMNGFNNR